MAYLHVHHYVRTFGEMYTKFIASETTEYSIHITGHTLASNSEHAGEFEYKYKYTSAHNTQVTGV